MARQHVRHAQIPEVRVEGKRLGRHIVHDERSHDFSAETSSTVKDVDHGGVGLPLNQANVGSCTGEALVAAGNCQPELKASEKPRTQDDAYAVYGLETQLEGDPWPPNDPGGSGLMVCRAGKQMGWLSSYRHAFGIDHALRALVLRPVIFGIPWYEGFDSPDADGIVRISGRVRGGHEICAKQIITTHELVGFWQSWGPWGYRGSGLFFMPWSDLDACLQQQGDATVPYFR